MEQKVSLKIDLTGFNSAMSKIKNDLNNITAKTVRITANASDIDEVKKKISQLPKDTKISLNLKSNSVEEANNAKKALDGIPNIKNINVNVQTGTSIARIGFLGASITGLKSAIDIAVRGFDFMKSAIEGAIENEQSIAKLNTVIRSTGNLTGIGANEFKKMADEMARISNYEDDEILSQVTSTLLTFKNIGGDLFKESQQAVVDMAAMFGGDLQTNAIRLGKAINDPVSGLGSLSKIGIQFSEEQEKQIKNYVKMGNLAKAQQIILNEVNSQVGGQAKAQVSPLESLKKTFKEVTESLAGRLIPLLKTMASTMKSFVTTGMVSFITQMGAAYLITSKIIPNITNQVNKYKQAKQELAESKTLLDEMNLKLQNQIQHQRTIMALKKQTKDIDDKLSKQDKEDFDNLLPDAKSVDLMEKFDEEIERTSKNIEEQTLIVKEQEAAVKSMTNKKWKLLLDFGTLVAAGAAIGFVVNLLDNLKVKLFDVKNVTLSWSNVFPLLGIAAMKAIEPITKLFILIGKTFNKEKWKDMSVNEIYDLLIGDLEKKAGITSSNMQKNVDEMVEANKRKYLEEKQAAKVAEDERKKEYKQKYQDLVNSYKTELEKLEEKHNEEVRLAGNNKELLSRIEKKYQEDKVKLNNEAIDKTMQSSVEYYNQQQELVKNLAKTEEEVRLKNSESNNKIYQENIQRDMDYWKTVGENRRKEIELLSNDIMLAFKPIDSGLNTVFNNINDKMNGHKVNWMNVLKAMQASAINIFGDIVANYIKGLFKQSIADKAYYVKKKAMKVADWMEDKALNMESYILVKEYLFKKWVIEKAMYVKDKAMYVKKKAMKAAHLVWEYAADKKAAIKNVALSTWTFMKTLPSIIMTIGAKIFSSFASIPFGLGYIPATALIATIIGSIKKLGKGFKSGGYTGSGSDDEEAGVVHKGEYVIPAKNVKGNLSYLNTLNTMLSSGYKLSDIMLSNKTNSLSPFSTSNIEAKLDALNRNLINLENKVNITVQTSDPRVQIRRENAIRNQMLLNGER